MNRTVYAKTACLITTVVSLSVYADRKEDLVNPISYEVTVPDGYIDSPIDPKTVYDNRPRGYVDNEQMPVIEPVLIPELQLPPPTVIPHGDYEPVERIVSVEKKAPPLQGEDLIFERIARDELEIKCALGDALDECEGIEIEAPKENKPRSRRVIDAQIPASGTN